MCKDVSKLDFDIALIGCGAYGFPLGNFIFKKMKKTAIQLGGTVQVFFGIKGKRWEGQFDECDYRKFFNNYWVRPSDEETPLDDAKNVENGCYW